jgi:hypothetical protein
MEIESGEVSKESMSECIVGGYMNEGKSVEHGFTSDAVLSPLPEVKAKYPRSLGNEILHHCISLTGRTYCAHDFRKCVL